MSDPKATPEGSEKSRRLRPPMIKPAEPGHNTLAVGLTLLVVAGGAILVLLSTSTRSTAGARVSTRLQWERREAELDRIIAQARAEGKLPKVPPEPGRIHERR